MRVYRIEHRQEPSYVIDFRSPTGQRIDLPVRLGVFSAFYSGETHTDDWFTVSLKMSDPPSVRTELGRDPIWYEVCGFDSLAQMKRWFSDKIMDYLRQHLPELVIAEYDVPDVFHGRWQVVFDATEAVLVAQHPL